MRKEESNSAPELNIFVGIIVALVFLVILPIVLYKSSDCGKESDMKDQYYSGVIVAKYQDSTQHAYDTWNIQPFNKPTYYKVHLVHEDVVIYNLSEVGDTIYKPRGTLRVLLKRNDLSIDTAFVYDCN